MRCKAVDVDPAWDTDTAARTLAEELLLAGPIEVGIDAGAVEVVAIEGITYPIAVFVEDCFSAVRDTIPIGIPVPVVGHPIPVEVVAGFDGGGNAIIVVVFANKYIFESR